MNLDAASGNVLTVGVQKRLPLRLMGCLAPRRVEGPAATLSLPSESLELETACLGFFWGRAGGGEWSDDTGFLPCLRASPSNPEPDVELTTFFLSTGAGELIFSGRVGAVGFFSISCSWSSEFSVAESSSGFVLEGPGVVSGRSGGLVPVESSQSRI